MCVYACTCVLLLLSLSAPAVAQEYEGQDRVHQNSGFTVVGSSDVNDIGCRAGVRAKRDSFTRPAPDGATSPPSSNSLPW